MLVQCFSTWTESPPCGRFLIARGQKNKGDDGGTKQHKAGENAQPLIDHRVNFSTLQLCLLSFLQILIYYDNYRWRLLLKKFICWIFTLDCLCDQLPVWIFQGCRAVVKMTQLQPRSSSFHEHDSSSDSGALGFHECSSGSFFPCLQLQLRLLFVFTH